uniref:ATP synthase F0 subunit 8 n=1 Tax=Phyllomimus sp. ZJZ-2017 TaxID=1945541 RepID=A0A1Q1MPD4_9ORTH|nr:ATP synthase F0 subunit 8 [Phyllomimus sp. ZJZ-2017]
MPQMSPMNWTSLLMTFSILLIFFIIMNYNNKTIFPPKITIMMPSSNKFMIWTW